MLVIKDCNQDWVAYAGRTETALELAERCKDDAEGEMCVWWEDSLGRFTPVLFINDDKTIEILKEGY